MEKKNLQQETMRIARLISNAGICSRRCAETLIKDGRVKLNGQVIFSPAINVSVLDYIEVDDVAVNKSHSIRLFIYYKPYGLITTNNDPQGRPTIFEELQNLPRVVSVGRLDICSEGLLLLTTNGMLARKLELPSSQLERVYKVRAYGNFSKIFKFIDKKFPASIVVSNIKYNIKEIKLLDPRPLSLSSACSSSMITKKNVIDYTTKQPEYVYDKRKMSSDNYSRVVNDEIRSSKNNKWFEVSLCEGKNREIRKVFSYFGLEVNRLIRIKYGPFLLGDLKPGEFKEQPLNQFRQFI